MSQTGLALAPDALRSPAETTPGQTAMSIRPILSHELVVGDYLGVIASMHQPAHFRRVEKLEYIDADLGRPHLKHDVFYLEAAKMGPVIAWCHGIAGPLILPAGDVHIWLDVPKTGRQRTSRTATGASSAAGRSHCSASLACPTRPTPGSKTESRNSRPSGNATRVPIGWSVWLLALGIGLLLTA